MTAGGSARARRVWRLVNSLGSVAGPPPEPTDTARVVAELGPDTAFDLLVAHRVYTPALRRLTALEPTPAVAVLRDRLAKLQKAEDARRARVREVTRATLALAAEEDAHVIKGLVLRTYYRDPELRHEGDIDLHVATWDAARRVALRLRAAGWEWDTGELPWLKWTDGGFLYGQLSLLLPNRDGTGDEDGDARVDLHIGPYSVGHGGLLPLVGWQDGTVLETPVRVPSTESTLALMGAHAMNDSLLSQKDVNDLTQIVARGEPVDWGSVEELAGVAGAAAAVRQIRRQALAPAARRGLLAPGPLAVRGPTGLPRALRFGRLALADELRRGGTLRAAPTAWQALRYFNADLAPRLADGPGEDMTTTPRGRTTCWRLVPEPVWRRWTDGAMPGPTPADTRAEPLAEDLRLVTRGPAAAVRGLGEVFLPTVTGRVSAASVALARDLADR